MGEPRQLLPPGIEDAIDPDNAWVHMVLREYAPAVGALLRARYPVFNAEGVEDVVIVATARL